MRISRIDTWHVAMPLAAPFHPSWIPGMRQTENRFDLVRLTTDSGIVGHAAAPALAHERAGWGSLLGTYFLGERADDLLTIRQRIREMGYLGHRAGWLEPACWDIVGKARCMPVYQMLGGTGVKVKLYASTGEMKDGPQRVAEVQQRMAEGFEAVKLRVHAAEMAQDLDQITVVAKAVGDRCVLGVDANQAWRVVAVSDAPLWGRQRALEFCKAAQELGYTWVEEPLPMDDYNALAALCGQVDIAIAGGELNGHGLPEHTTMIEKGCYDWFQPDAVMCGGIAETYAIARRAQRAGRKYTPHTWTNGVGLAVNLAVYAAVGDRQNGWLEYPLDPPGWMPHGRDALLRKPFLHDRGWLTLPDGPGLGIEIDGWALRRYGTHTFAGSRLRVAASAVRMRGVRNAMHLDGLRRARIEARMQALGLPGTDPMLDVVHALAEGTSPSGAPAPD